MSVIWTWIYSMLLTFCLLRNWEYLSLFVSHPSVSVEVIICTQLFSVCVFLFGFFAVSVQSNARNVDDLNQESKSRLLAEVGEMPCAHTANRHPGESVLRVTILDLHEAFCVETWRESLEQPHNPH